MIKYSVVLRAYNAEEHMEKGIRSVLDQTYINWELIVVNDGSTDNTRAIAEQYAKKDSRIKVVNQENKGCVLATQAGIAASTADYVTLLDADDWYEKEYLEKVNQAVLSYEPDMVVVNYRIIDFIKGNTNFQYFAEPCIQTEKQAMELFLRTTNFALWNKVIKLDRIQYDEAYMEFLVKAGKTTNFGEDLYQLMPILCNCNKVCFIPDCLYNYLTNDGSITHQKAKDPWVEVLQRTRLMETTYRTIEQWGYLTDTIHEIIQWNAATFVAPFAAKIVKSFLLETENIKQLRRNKFYKEVVSKISGRKLAEKLSAKTVIGFVLFNKLLLRV